MDIRYATNESPFGWLLVAATEKGICMVSLGDSDQDLTEALRERYPAADYVQDASYFKEVTPVISNYLSGHQPRLDLPVDIRATAFRLKVYEALKAIPYGETCSYEEVARAVGSPKAVRAVGSACANNPVALVIPCHRVVRKDGSLGGYRWGLKRKEKLLEMERRLTPHVT
jgi:AraC family transcriptional regulator of adaptative response/methylated-DNA-[protein]-cysteine methyltransferase